MSWIKTLTEALNQSLKSKLDKKEAFGTFAKKADLFSRSYNDLKDKPRYAEVATTGSYNDLVDKIPYATVGASLGEYQLEYKDNSYNSTPINTQLSFVVKKEENPYLGYGSAYYTIFRDSEGLVTLAMQPRNNIDYPYFLPSNTVHVNGPEGRSISSFGGFNVINGKLYIYEGYPDYGLFIADLNNKYSDDNVWKVDAEYISLPDSFYRTQWGRLSKVQINAIEYCDEYYYIHVNKEASSVYVEGDVVVYKTSDFVTYEATPIKVGHPVQGYSVDHTLKMCGDKLVVMPDRSPAPFYVLDSEHDNWIEIPNMIDDPSRFGTIKYSLYNETLNIVTVFFGGDAYVCDASKLLDVDNFSWKKINDPVEHDFESSMNYVDHIVPDQFNHLDKPVSVIGTYYRYYYSYDGYTWHAVEVNDYRNICFVNIVNGNFLIYALKANGESGLLWIRMSNGIVVANTEYSGYTDVTSELAVAIRNKIGFVEPPPFDGAYKLKCTVVDGVPTYTWEEDIPDGDEVSY